MLNKHIDLLKCLSQNYIDYTALLDYLEPIDYSDAQKSGSNAKSWMKSIGVV
jgi:hypothetical protein